MGSTGVKPYTRPVCQSLRATQCTGAIINGVKGCPETQKRSEGPRMYEDVRWMYNIRITVL